MAELHEQRDDRVEHDTLGRQQLAHVMSCSVGMSWLVSYFLWSAATASCRSVAAFIKLLTSCSVKVNAVLSPAVRLDRNLPPAERF